MNKNMMKLFILFLALIGKASFGMHNSGLREVIINIDERLCASDSGGTVFSKKGTKREKLSDDVLQCVLLPYIWNYEDFINIGMLSKKHKKMVDEHMEAVKSLRIKIKSNIGGDTMINSFPGLVKLLKKVKRSDSEVVVINRIELESPKSHKICSGSYSYKGIIEIDGLISQVKNKRKEFIKEEKRRIKERERILRKDSLNKYGVLLLCGGVIVIAAIAGGGFATMMLIYT